MNDEKEARDCSDCDAKFECKLTSKQKYCRPCRSKRVSEAQTRRHAGLGPVDEDPEVYVPRYNGMRGLVR